MRPRFVVVLLAAAGALALAAACDDGTTPQPCTDIPPGGCPISRGVACEDPRCEAVYACRPDNVWELQERCPEREAGVAQVDAAAAETGAPVFDAAVDAPPGAYGGPGCESLQLPDCALGVVLGCGNCCGCEDLFVCEDEGWTLWGSCGDGGLVPEE